jgi:hypothetical protein
MPAVVPPVIDRGRGTVHDINANHRRSEHGAQMMRDEAIAATHIEHF